MEHIKIKNILNHSEEIKKIPDNWIQTMPFVCEYNNEMCDAFLYCIAEEDDNESITQLFLISNSTQQIYTFTEADIVNKFGVDTTIQMKKISDNSAYLSTIDEYERLFNKFHRELIEKKNFEEKQQIIELYKEIEGEDLFNKVTSIIAKGFYY